ncbi:TraX family protein [Alkalibacterium iburiense]|uniref:TraX family protein n=1 Tax=Alkalibacterium iburiense TaxID=290589 RepID=A0ABP3HJP3_9LACT
MQKIKNSEALGSGLTSHSLKMIAITAMFIDHFSYLVAPTQTPLEWILHFVGRTAAPIMFFLIAEGHYHTSDKKRYFFRLLLFAVISHFPYVIYFDLPLFGASSVIWTLAMGLMALIAAKNKHYSIPVKTGIILLSCLLAYNANWNYIGVLWTLNFGLFRGDFKKQAIGFTTIGIILYLIQGLIRVGPHVSYRIGVFVPLILIYLYNGKRGSNSTLAKWSFYIFYPLHFIILYLLKMYVFNGFA